MFCKCNVCGFTCVVPDGTLRPDCPLCWEDCLHRHPMLMRPATDEDRAEGVDSRKEPA
jgi:hypothetical protein